MNAGGPPTSNPAHSRERAARLRALFDAALDLRDQAARVQFLHRECGSDGVLLAEVLERLAALDASGSSGFPAGPYIHAAGLALALRAARLDNADAAGVADHAADDANPPNAAATRRAPAAPLPDHIGGYRIFAVLGEGGMGIVYRAEQPHPRRTVALKVMRPGETTPSQQRRFEYEAAALARLQHPGIAQIYEAGIAEAAGGPQPFLAMELVEGQRLTDYAAARQLDARARLELLAKVCDALQHAHQMGVIHRDLKPGNILVTADGQPKIVDFGVARASDPAAQATSVHTGVGQLVGTVPYMSPEQVVGDPAQVDTRSDVYSLGVLAYELLAQRLPYDLSHRSAPELPRIIQDETPIPLSSVSRLFRGDVETIVGKALEKDRARRYQSAGDLASDIRRYLRNEPIVARPPSRRYQLYKFALRNKLLTGGLAAVLLVLAGGVVSTNLALRRALSAEANLITQLAEVERARAGERARATELRSVAEFQAQMLRQVDAARAGVQLVADLREKLAAALAQRGLPAFEQKAQVASLTGQLDALNVTDVAVDMIDETILRPALAAIDAQFRDQPLVYAALCQTLGDTYGITLGRYDAALPLVERALGMREQFLGAEHEDTLSSLSSVASCLIEKGDLSAAERLCREAVARHRRVFGDDDRRTVLCVRQLGALLLSKGQCAEAERCLHEVLEQAPGVLHDPVDAVAAVNDYMWALREQGRWAEAEPYARECLARCATLAESDASDWRTALPALAQAYANLDLWSEAEPYFLRYRERCERELGTLHPDTIAATKALGTVCQSQGRLDEAESHFRSALDGFRRVLGEKHQQTLGALLDLGIVLLARGKLAEAESHCRLSVQLYTEVLGETHTLTLTSQCLLRTVLAREGKLTDAEAVGRALVATNIRIAGPDHWWTATTRLDLANILALEGRWAEAEQEYLEAERALALAVDPPAIGHHHTCVGALIALYDSWNIAQPYQGYDRLASQWRCRLSALSTPPASAP